MQIRVPGGLARRPYLTGALALAIACGSVIVHDYLKYGRMVDEKLKAGILESASMIYAAPRTVVPGGTENLDQLAAYLRRCGYSESRNNALGWYQIRKDAIEVHPGPAAYIQESATIQTQAGRVARIVALQDQSDLSQLQLEPEVITNLFDQTREKQLIVH